METCDEPHPENTSAHTAGAESNKRSAQAATRQEGAQSHILHNPAQVCELLPGALLPRRDAARELHEHARGAAGYIFTCFGKLSPAISRVQAVPPRRGRCRGRGRSRPGSAAPPVPARSQRGCFPNPCSPWLWPRCSRELAAALHSREP